MYLMYLKICATENNIEQKHKETLIGLTFTAKTMRATYTLRAYFQANKSLIVFARSASSQSMYSVTERRAYRSGSVASLN